MDRKSTDTSDRAPGVRGGWDAGTQRYCESIDLEDAFHPQTILAYELNDTPLPLGER